MRTTTAQQATALASASRSVFFRVFVDRGVGDWVDLSTLEGRNWCQSASWGDSEDGSVATAGFGFYSRVENLSLAPLVDGSKLNAAGTILDIGNPIYLQVAVMTDGATPSATDWIEVFRGEIDEIEWPSSIISVRCRDKGGLLDRFIETQSKRPFSLNVAPVERVAQEILDGAFGENVIKLYSINGTASVPFQPSDSPGWFISEYVQQKQPVLQALRTLADQIGWYIRQVWNDSTGAFELTLYEPPRSVSARGTLTFTGQPVAAQTFTLNGSTFTARASGAVANEFNIGSTVIETCSNVVAMLLSGAQAANIGGAWVNPARSHVGTLTFTGQPTAGQTVTIGTFVFTAVAGTPGNFQFQIAGTTTGTIDNLVASVNGGGQGTPHQVWATRVGSAALIQWATPGSTPRTFIETLSNATANGGGLLGGTVAGHDGAVTIEWGTKGTAGNSITFTEALTNVAADGGGFLGGTRLGRAAGGDQYTFGPSRYYEPTRLSISRAGIRNVLRVKFGVTQFDRTTVEVFDSNSITKYGRRFMEIAEAGSSQIDTEGEARAMADAILQDLAEPEANLTVPIPFYWPVELIGDTVTFTANGVHFDTDQTLAVVAARHSLSPGQSRTELAVRGKPSGGFKRWLELEARPGVAPQNDFYADNAAEGVAGAAALGMVVITYDDPRGMSPPIADWAFTDCYVDSTSDFTPGPASLVATGRTTRFEIGGLVPGQTYYCKLNIIDSSGNVAATTTQISVAAEKVGAYHENSDTLRVNLVPNGCFGQATKPIATTPPDGWSQTEGTWGTNAVEETEMNATGGRSIAFLPVSDAKVRIVSDFIPVSEFVPYAIHWYYAVSVYDSGNRGRVGWLAYDGSRNYLGEADLGEVTPAGFAFQRFGGTYQLGYVVNFPTTRFIRVFAERPFKTSPAFTLYCDRIHVFKQQHRFSVYRSTTQTIAASTATRVEYATEVYDRGFFETSARGTLTLTGQPTATQTFVIDSTTFTARASGAGANEFNIGATKEETAANIVACVNASTETATAWRIGSSCVFQWDTPGTVGNSKTFTEALSNATADGGGVLGSTLAGGIKYGVDRTGTNVGRFTCNEAGEYVFAAGAQIDFSSVAVTTWIALYKNGAVAHYGTRMVSGIVGIVGLSVSAQLSLARGDYVEVFVWHNYTGNQTLQAGQAASFFTGARVAGDE